MIASYRLSQCGDDYILQGTRMPSSGPERSWFQQHGETLVDTMAAPYGPDVVALLRNNTTYGVIGDHGGAQEEVQRIPMVFSWPGLKAAAPSGEMRLVDLLPTILTTMGIDFDPATMDGNAVQLPVSQ